MLPMIHRVTVLLRIFILILCEIHFLMVLHWLIYRKAEMEAKRKKEEEERKKREAEEKKQQVTVYRG